MTRPTSIDAYNTIKNNGLLSRARWEVYDALFEIGPATAMQIFEHLSKKFQSKVAANVYARLGELRDVGCVFEKGEIICSRTGMTVILWEVTERIPVKWEKPKKIKCQTCSGKGYVSEKQAKLF